MPSSKIKVGVLISGGGTNLQALIDAIQADPDFPAEIVTVLASKKSAYGLTRAKDADIAAHTVPYKDFATHDDFEDTLHRLLVEAQVDLICLAGFMKILSAGFIQKWEGRILNIHPALLPKFGGKGMYGHYVHEAVIAAGEKESGASVHIVTAGCDEGPVILQGAVPVQPDDTPDTLATRVLMIEHGIYPRALKKFAEQMLS
jgi:phosphoribosylglycinamide formyltransferase 1